MLFKRAPVTLAALKGWWGTEFLEGELLAEEGEGEGRPHHALAVEAPVELLLPALCSPAQASFPKGEREEEGGEGSGRRGMWVHLAVGGG